MITKEAILRHRDWVSFGRQGPGRIDLVGDDWSGADLVGVAIPGARLADCKLHRLKGSAMRFAESQLVACDFRGAVLEIADFEGAHLIGCRFVEANLGSAMFLHAHFVECSFVRARLPDTMWMHAHLVRCDFTGANLRKARFDDAILESCTLTDADRTEMSAQRTQFR